MNLGFGWDRTRNVIWRLRSGEFKNQTPKLVLLNIGTSNFSGTKNARANTPEEIAAAIQKICTLIHPPRRTPGSL